MIRTLALALLVSALALAAGCVYADIEAPLDTDLDHTTLGSKVAHTPVHGRHPGEAAGDIRHLTIPLGDVQADFAWNSNAIGEIARRNRMETVYYADLEFLNILGIRHEYTVHVYGR